MLKKNARYSIIKDTSQALDLVIYIENINKYSWMSFLDFVFFKQTSMEYPV